MKQLVLIEPILNVKEIEQFLTKEFIVVEGYFPINSEDKFSKTFYTSLHEAVEEADSILVHVSESYFDTLLLGVNGILVSIKEGTEISITTKLSADKLRVYTTFLSAKNQKLKCINIESGENKYV